MKKPTSAWTITFQRKPGESVLRQYIQASLRTALQLAIDDGDKSLAKKIRAVMREVK